MKPPESTPPKGGGIWARLFGLNDEATATPAEAGSDTTAAPGKLEPAAREFGRPESTDMSDALPLGLDDDSRDNAIAAVPALKAEASAPTPPAAATIACPACGASAAFGQEFCGDCGWMFSNTPALTSAPGGAAQALDHSESAVASPSPATPLAAPIMRLKDRYDIGPLLSERGGVCRFKAIDRTANPPQAVMIIQGPVQELPEAVLPPEASAAATLDEIMVPTIDEPLPVAQFAVEGLVPWPSVAWEHAILSKLDSSALPRIVEYFIEGEVEVLVVATQQGSTLWDAWDEPGASADSRYGLLEQAAQLLDALHKAGAICESLRPDIFFVSGEGQITLGDLSELVAFPLPPGTQVRATLYTAPELVLTPEQADARADLYGFGATLYALEYLHHDLEEKDFDRPFSPKLITDRYPDVHPGFFRLVCKTFTRDLHTRFPTDEASRKDSTGFTELIHTLGVCRRTFDSVRFDIAAWTTTGMVRTGNEDAFAFLHGMESRQDELTEYAMLLLCDGMGGYEAGEVAAALATASMRKNLLKHPFFSALAGDEAPAEGVFNVDECKKLLVATLKQANKDVYTAARVPGKGKRGMGCTAECVYVDNRHVVVGHVGDSRTYHLHEGRLVQLTRDQTLVNRLVELGQLTPEEAEDHPRKNELQQAIGGQPDVDPGVYHGNLKRGDWVLVCSDGLTNHIPAADLTMMLSREAMSAEDAARRLMNLVNLRGATDNATIVVIRAT
jgi:PPM family protein phosphatase